MKKTHRPFEYPQKKTAKKVPSSTGHKKKEEVRVQSQAEIMNHEWKIHPGGG